MKIFPKRLLGSVLSILFSYTAEGSLTNTVRARIIPNVNVDDSITLRMGILGEASLEEKLAVDRFLRAMKPTFSKISFNGEFVEGKEDPTDFSALTLNMHLNRSVAVTSRFRACFASWFGNLPALDQMRINKALESKPDDYDLKPYGVHFQAFLRENVDGCVASDEFRKLHFQVMNYPWLSPRVPRAPYDDLLGEAYKTVRDSVDRHFYADIALLYRDLGDVLERLSIGVSDESIIERILRAIAVKKNMSPSELSYRILFELVSFNNLIQAVEEKSTEKIAGVTRLSDEFIDKCADTERTVRADICNEDTFGKKFFWLNIEAKERAVRRYLIPR